MSYPVIYYILGRLLFATAVALCIPLAASFYWHEQSSLDFAAAISVSLCCAVYFSNKGDDNHDNISIREGIAITGLSWLIISFIIAIPYLSGHYMPPVDCLFEGVSGITGSGASVVTDIPRLPESIILWRSISHWLGGLGIIVIFIALFPQTGSSIIKMFEIETTGPTEDRPMPRIRSTAKVLLKIYTLLTFLLTALLLLCGLNLSDAVNNAMSAIATGGFATKNSSISYFNNLPAEIIIMVFMLIGGGNFSLYYIAWKRGLKKLTTNSELLVYLGLFSSITILITINLVYMTNLDPYSALRYSSFQTAAVISTTGFSTADFDSWPAFSKYCLLIVMLTGGCAGSTAGGIKIVRVILMFKMVSSIVKEKLSPNRVIHTSFDTRERLDIVINRVGRFCFLYMFITTIGAIIFAIDGLNIMDAIVLGISSIGNVGIAYGAGGNFAQLNNLTKLVCCMMMIIGRLEIFIFLVMLRPSFWQKGASW